MNKAISNLGIGDKLKRIYTGEICEVLDFYITSPDDLNIEEDIYYYFKGFSVKRDFLKKHFETDDTNKFVMFNEKN